MNKRVDASVKHKDVTVVDKNSYTIKIAILLVLVVVGFIVVGLATSSTTSNDITTQPVTQAPITPGQLLEEVNKRRTEVGVNPLTVDTRLGKSAQAKADDMKARNYFDHKDPDGKQGYELIYEYYPRDEAAYVSENITGLCSYNTASDTINSLMESTAHREAILDSKYSYIGFGIAYDTSQPGEGVCNGNMVQHFVEHRAKPMQVNVQNNINSNSRPPQSSYCTYNDYNGYLDPTLNCRSY